jgi:hypothetical protein
MRGATPSMAMRAGKNDAMNTPPRNAMHSEWNVEPLIGQA